MDERIHLRGCCYSVASGRAVSDDGEQIVMLSIREHPAADLVSFGLYPRTAFELAGQLLDYAIAAEELAAEAARAQDGPQS